MIQQFCNSLNFDRAIVFTYKWQIPYKKLIVTVFIIHQLNQNYRSIYNIYSIFMEQFGYELNYKNIIISHK